MRSFFVIVSLLVFHSVSGQCNFYGSVQDRNNEAVSFARIQFWSVDSVHVFQQYADEFGRFHFEKIPCTTYYLKAEALGFEKLLDTLLINQPELSFSFVMTEKTKSSGEVVVTYDSPFETQRMSIIDGAVLTHSKKTQLVDVNKIPSNLATNNAREIFATVPGLNIWESDGGGLQIGIGARGLSPNRTEHFNTRQNGYDMSADALGYPETYYTPPSEAIESIQFIRGAASLQFGPQFGGMVNFKLRPASKKVFEYRGSQTYGAYNLINTFNSFSGTIKNRFSYLFYYNYKQGDGWRANSGFYQHNAFGQLKYQFTENMFLSVEYTYMNYLAQQAGGLTDAMFKNDPRQSIRERNWFKVDWQILAANYSWKVNSRFLVDFKFFSIDASRSALGNLDKISRLDDYLERDLIQGTFKNFGAELRILQKYPVGKKMKGAITYGARYYQGLTTNVQGLADSTYQPNFRFLDSGDPIESDYIFPSQNVAGYFENMIQLNDKIWISAGFRYEFIRTSAEGNYSEKTYHPLTNELLFDTTYYENKTNQRNVYLGGVGLTWRIKEDAEIYSNVAQNYRGINFSDIRIVNPNIQVDPDMEDEKGFNADLGIRAEMKSWKYDCSFFFLYYDNKIGLTDKKISDYEFIRFRTNLGNAYSTGMECYAEHRFKSLPYKTPEHYFSFFVNLAFVYAKYGISSEPAFSGNFVELVPPITAKTGIRYHGRVWLISILGSYVHKQFSDATNAKFDPDAVAGIIPSYYVIDFSGQYKLSEKFIFKGGINNLTNNHYFTRRATGYPGPGIIPSDGIGFYLNVSISL